MPGSSRPNDEARPQRPQLAKTARREKLGRCRVQRFVRPGPVVLPPAPVENAKPAVFHRKFLDSSTVESMCAILGAHIHLCRPLYRASVERPLPGLPSTVEEDPPVEHP